MDVILLNGPSSAGKSSLAKKLETKIRGTKECRVIALDDYMTMTAEEPIWEDDVFAAAPGMCADIARALAENHLVIVDHVITSRRVYDLLMAAVGCGKCLKVLVSCSLDTLRAREKSRGNRPVGAAEASLKYLYPKEGYDIRLDSGRASPEQMADEILRYISGQA